MLAQDAQGATLKDPGGAGLVFGRPPAHEVLRTALSTEPGGRAHAVEPSLLALGSEYVPGLPPPSLLSDSWRHITWHDVVAVTWKHVDHIHLGEARALNLWLEVLCRFSHTRHSRLLDLCDSQSATGAFAKGRSSSFTLNRLMRKRAALEIAADVSIIVAWVCSADQPADKLSRLRKVKGLIRGARQHRKQCRDATADHPLDRGSI